jgi:glycosyltransferase involved in cell wall biosynthesis
VGPALRALVRELGVEEHTHFIGLLRGSERLMALADADLVVYPSDHEVFGLVPLEALLCGSPVIWPMTAGAGHCRRARRWTGDATRHVTALADAIQSILLMRRRGVPRRGMRPSACARPMGTTS